MVSFASHKYMHTIGYINSTSMIVCMFLGPEFPPWPEAPGIIQVRPHRVFVYTHNLPFRPFPDAHTLNSSNKRQNISARRLLVIYVNACGRCVIASDLATSRSKYPQHERPPRTDRMILYDVVYYK